MVKQFYEGRGVDFEPSGDFFVGRDAESDSGEIARAKSIESLQEEIRHCGQKFDRFPQNPI